ncbi:AarF/ABC1/UbiB kinase family protein [Altererythrobacter aurantiacus]|uniref:AarF/ABC1/UbiB kinase family protein n=1 Tax=Parapontixanthobacter aurantiacus TaxID=1463599 RepID=A0A844ZD84_9SPHN|nr:AarF/ABC1/UbiB kinase family protein [Parapontixanthobacter aurantiacus]MXO85136.1 AarF/ABC1/UbiB kinase family protein [Parapontixanthobacter aurantiacus]
MSDNDNPGRHRAVPSGRLSRLSGFTRLAGGVAGGMMAEGARRLAAGERPRVNEMLLTPGNAKRLTERLSHLRGAAMKLGQMISMDAGDVLPPELADILASLRDNANFMPPKQLDTVLAAQWGKDWRKQFRRFEPRPIAAASIGQVHRAVTRDDKSLAIKVQYPGVARSIDSDVDNVASLLRLSGLLPKELDIDPLLTAAKEQLHEEADYLREGEQMRHFAERLTGNPDFTVPRLYEELTRPQILAMSFEEGIPIEQLAGEAQDVRDRVFGKFIELVSKELFEFGVMQTDPNFANYRYNPETGRIVLLDFGATRDLSDTIRGNYRRLIEAGLAQDSERLMTEAVAAGFVSPATIERHRPRVERMIDIIVGEMAADKPFDFGNRAFVPLLRDEGMAIAQDRKSWHIPPAETLFVQRKVSGTALLGARLKAVVDVRGIVSETLAANPVTGADQ